MMPINSIQFRKASTQEWVTLSSDRDPLDEDAVRLNGVKSDGSDLVLEYANIPGNSWNTNRLKKYMDAVNSILEYRTPIASLPLDDPARISDPGLPRFFWDGTDIVSRSIAISEAYYTPEPGLIFTCRRIR